MASLRKRFPFTPWFSAKLVLGLSTFICLSWGHYWHLSTLFENDRFFSHLSQMEREMTFRTEQGLYYSFYKRIVKAETFVDGVTSIMAESTIEYPDTINYVQRFNIYPEVALGLFYRIFSKLMSYLEVETVSCWRIVRGQGQSDVESCIGFGEPFYVYLFGVFSLNGLLLGFLFLTGWFLSQSFIGGIITVLSFMFNHGEATRVMWTPPLRESFGYPFFVMEMLVVSYILRSKTTQWRMSFLVAALSTLFMLQWQFAQFILLTQLLSVLGVFILGWTDITAVWTVVRGLFLGLIGSFVLLFGNTMLMTSFYGVLTVLCFFLLHPKWQLDQRYLRVYAILTAVSTPLVKTLVTTLLGQEDDKHVWNIFRSKFTSYRDFHTMLYTCAPEFDFLPIETLRRLFVTGLLPSAGIIIGACLVYICHHLYLMINWNRYRSRLLMSPQRSIGNLIAKLSRHQQSQNTDFKQTPKVVSNMHAPVADGYETLTTGPVSAEIVYHLLQSLIFMFLAIMIMRLKLLWTPQLCILSSLLASRKLFGFVGRPLHLVLLVAIVSAMCYPGIQNLKQQHSIIGEYSNYPLEHMLVWIKKNTPNKAVFAGSMATMANLHLSTGRSIVNHPHYENTGVRQRTKNVYSMYGRFSPLEVHELHKNMGVDYVVFETSYCFYRHKPGCTIGDMWDSEFPEKRSHDLCCQQILSDPFPFRWIYKDNVYSILKV